jgi:CheY-like chemotaxis protein
VFHICFVDDDKEFEIPLFYDIFGEIFDIIAASDYDELQSQIDSRENWKPDLFVLDLYFPFESENQEAINALRSEPLYLKNDHAEIRTAYINYLKARERLTNVLNAWKQNINGGLTLAERIAAEYPDVPIVFYSRKATIEDIIRCLTARNVWSVERKPTGKDSSDTIELTKLARQHLVQRFQTAILRADSAKLKRNKEAAKILMEMLRDCEQN